MSLLTNSLFGPYLLPNYIIDSRFIGIVSALVSFGLRILSKSFTSRADQIIGDSSSAGHEYT